MTVLAVAAVASVAAGCGFSSGGTASPTPPRPTAVLAATAAAKGRPLPTPMHPLALDYLRARRYESEVTIEGDLPAGTNYSRFLASYPSDDLKIYALLTVPSGEPPPSGWPVVIFNHGYIPPAQYRTTERYVAYVDAFAKSGYIVFKSDYRGHGNSEGRPAGAYGSPAYTIDVLNAVAAMKVFPGADPRRIGMWGHSMGGYITLRAMVATPDVRGGVIWAGVVASYPDLFSRWHRPRTGGNAPHRPSPWRNGLTLRFGTPEENPAFWASISANSQLDSLSGPLQLHHGTADTTVPFAFSENLVAQVEAAGGYAELYAYPGDNHNISASFSTAAAKSVAFFDTYVKNAPPTGLGTRFQ